MVLAVVGCTSEPNAPPVAKAASTNAATTNAAAAKPATTNALAPTVLTTNAAEAAEAPVQKVAPKPVALPPGADQVAELAQAGVGEAVLLEFVKNSTNAYNLNVDEIVYLTDVGIPEPVLAAMLRHGKEMQEQTAPATEAPAPVAEAPPPPPPAAASAAAPAHEAQSATVAPEAPAPVTEAPAPPAPATETQYIYTSPPTQVTYNYFYETLSPYGSWMELPGYGWCWQPTCGVVDPLWQPYWHRGHWAYTDCGWYWASDYSWGWAPFHYGRWSRHHGHGWLWSPGYVWGPAWVTWRHWDTYCGWAPLPPEVGWDVHLGLTHRGAAVALGFGFGLRWDSFAFVHYRNLCHSRVWEHRLPRQEVTKVYSRSMVVNNIVPGRGGVIVNGGIAPERVKAITRREVPKTTLRDISPGPGSVHRPDRYDRETKELAVYRPKPPANGMVSPSKPAEPAYQPARRLQEARKESLGSPAPDRRPGASLGVRSLPAAPTAVQPGRSATRTGAQAPVPSRLAEERKLTAPAPASPSASTTAPRRVTESPRREVSPAPATPAPARGVSPRAPTYQPAPGSPPRYPAPAPAAPTQRRPSSEPAAPTRRQERSYAPPTGGSASPPAVARSETRKVQPVTPSYTPPPKFASAPPAAPSYSPAPAPSMPRFAPAPAYAPAPSAPSRPSFSPPASSAPSYAPPPRISSPAPSPSGPSGRSERGGGGGSGGRNRAN
jgi:hypothetical protein